MGKKATALDLDSSTIFSDILLANFKDTNIEMVDEVSIYPSV
jgi:hypothetical protein